MILDCRPNPYFELERLHVADRDKETTWVVSHAIHDRRWWQWPVNAQNRCSLVLAPWVGRVDARPQALHFFSLERVCVCWYLCSLCTGVAL